MVHQNKNIYVSLWLLLITFLVAVMIIIGGLTRLTDSGLSITRWDLFSGIIPPLTPIEWEKSFQLYKEIPEFILLYPTMNMEQFKIIFWWEFIHRLLGRIVGIFYIFPLIYFTYNKTINSKFLVFFYFIFLLILLQGYIGWYMVQSGLIDRTDVSHYRLSVHLTLAFIILACLFWGYLCFINKDNLLLLKKIPLSLITFFLILIFIQISIGALVSGLDAGKIYQSWPLMNGNYFPNDSNIIDVINLKFFEIPSLVQFLHRNLAYIIFIFFIIILYIIFKNDELYYLKKYAIIVFSFLLLQIILGILTIIHGAPIILSSLHQIGSIFLVISTLVLIFKSSKTN